jgi:phosphoribosylanthranilate isomerase
MKLKVCGNRDNIQEVASLNPDYMGFIYWEPSSRAMDPEESFEGLLPPSIKKIGVFVDAETEFIQAIATRHKLDFIQLHGKESVEDLRALKERTNVPLIKVFAPTVGFDFDQLRPYSDLVDFFLFDTKGKLPGGNGVHFDWRLLENYKEEVPYFLSGGIGPDSVDQLNAFKALEASNYCVALDINSKFELAPGLKNINAIAAFKKAIIKNT